MIILGTLSDLTLHLILYIMYYLQTGLIIKTFRITSESFLVFFSFGTILNIILSIRTAPLTTQMSETTPQ